jgi:hypothetical protein
MEVEGIIKVIGESQSFGTNNFTKREVVVTTEEQYPQVIMVEFVQDKCGLLDSFKIGENVKIGINIRGREWVNPKGETKYFNSIQGWRIEKLHASPESNSQSHIPDNNDDGEDPLPF